MLVTVCVSQSVLPYFGVSIEAITAKKRVEPDYEVTFTSN